MEHDTTMARDQLKLESVSLPNPIWLEQHKLTRIYEMSLGDWDEFWMPLQTVDALFVGGISLITTKVISTQSCP